MTKTLRFFEASTASHLVLVLVLAITLGMMLAAPKAHAESPNILVGPNMTVGSTGSGVVVLQGILSEAGYLNIPTGISMGYYGALTQAAVGRYQLSKNVSPAVGYFGPLTKVAMHTDLMARGWLPLLGW